jgi:hypothetical protein
MDRYDHDPSPADRSDLGGWEPRPRRRSAWASPALAAGLAVVLVVMLGTAVLLSSLGPGSGGAPTVSGAPSPSAVAASPSGSARPSFVRPTPTPLPTFTVYLVKGGDSLNSIAREFRTTARSIAFWNRDAYPSLDPLSPDYEPDIVQVGWRLRLIPGQVFDEDSLPTLPPGSAPPSTGPTSAPTPIPTPGGPAAVVSRGPGDSGEVALTFDIGGRLDPAVDIMNWLVANRVKATIFPFTDLSAAEMADQLRRTEDAIASLIGRSTRPWFRPPYGAWDATVRNGVGEAGWHTLVMWDIDTIDWRPTSDGGPTATDIEAKVLGNARAGSIVLMHLGGWHTLEALPGIVDGLTDRGLRPATLDELLSE